MSCSGTDREQRTADSGTPAEKLLRLKRSLTFMRSKSVENFFQRSQSDAYRPTELFSGALPSSPASGNSSNVLPSPSISSRPAPFGVQPRPAQTHSFLEHVFRRPTSCSLCKLIIAGNSKQGLRCRTCKMGAHLWCLSEVSEKPCQGKSGMFKRNLSTPVLTNDQLYAVKTPESKAQLDPVYATLRFGTSLASRSSVGSLCESPSQSLDEEDGQLKDEYVSTEQEKLTENQRKDTDVSLSENNNSEMDEISKVPKVHPIHTYVALYKFLPQEQNDLELHPGDRVMVIDDSNEEWWKGKCGDRVGLFPSNFVQRVRPGERVWKVTQSVHGSKDLGHLTVKEAQICVGKNEEADGFLKLSSGKKRGLVPTDSLEEI
ncbi:SH3 and cysteine-rich domain-containing protein 2-like [Puntigrus tetrazona]|uniref:SH3 and cysteine-rich domain-containing protein 2-like n=1 Tax=Puntigrus tetrazona TaxID=1606681 RepID=UPI001C893E60|nr:SH3 and cysteine-rich domain-containing protein 2-like [Puntigrus tetrazona]XP_043090033.1 SH3 and cysteine-rich domain-containing protein 2-like [Puntigrus tetrazona]